jgi:hypothetical protein
MASGHSLYSKVGKSSFGVESHSRAGKTKNSLFAMNCGGEQWLLPTAWNSWSMLAIITTKAQYESELQ